MRCRLGVLRRLGVLGAGLLVIVLPLTACGADQPSTGPEPSGVSIAPSTADPGSEPPASPAPSARATTPAKPSASDPSTAQSEDQLDATGAVAAAEAAVPDSTAVEVSQDDDSAPAEWEVTVRVGDRGRELRIAGNGTVVGNEGASLSSAQRGALPKITATAAIRTAEKRVDGGVVTDAELSQENGQRVWDVSVDAGRDTEWELWIDAESGKVLRAERD